MRKIDVTERQARIGRRHRLAPSAQAASPLEVAESLVVLHATDPSTVHLSVAARIPGATVTDTEQALYDDRSLLRMLGMRRTVFVVPTTLAGVVQTACTDDIAVRQRKLLIKHLAEAGVPDPANWLADVEASTAKALLARGSATATQLGEDEPRLRTRLSMGEGKAYAAQPYVSGCCSSSRPTA